MDLSQTISDLYAQKERLDCIIAELESLARSRSVNAISTGNPRRGRKSVGIEERQRISERMRAHWAAKRADGSGRSGVRSSARELQMNHPQNPVPAPLLQDGSVVERAPSKRPGAQHRAGKSVVVKQREARP